MIYSTSDNYKTQVSPLRKEGELTSTTVIAYAKISDAQLTIPGGKQTSGADHRNDSKPWFWVNFWLSPSSSIIFDKPKSAMTGFPFSLIRMFVWDTRQEVRKVSIPYYQTASNVITHAP